MTARIVQRALPRDHFVWLVSSLCRMSHCPFDSAALLKRFPGPHSVRHLLDAAHHHGFLVLDGAITAPQFPCVAFMKGEAGRAAIAIGSDSSRLYYFPAAEHALQSCPFETLSQAFEQHAYLVRHLQDPYFYEEDGERPRFGLKKILRGLFGQARVRLNEMLPSISAQPP